MWRSIILMALVGCVQPLAPVVVPVPVVVTTTTVPRRGTSTMTVPVPTTTTTTLPAMPGLPRTTKGEHGEVVEITTGNGEDCTTYCAARFGAGVGVTCQAALTTAGTCLRRCFYQNGWWYDASTGAAIRRPDGTANDQRPFLTQVPPYGYASLHGYEINAWLECPGGWQSHVPAPRGVWESCIVFARGEYKEGESWCTQGGGS